MDKKDQKHAKTVMKNIQEAFHPMAYVAPEESINVGTCAIAPMPNVFMSAFVAGVNPLHAGALVGVAAGAYTCHSNLKWLRTKPETGNMIVRELKVAKRSASVQQVCALTAMPTLAYDATRLNKHIQKDGLTPITGVSLAFTLAVAAGLAANYVRASRVKIKIHGELRKWKNNPAAH